MALIRQSATSAPSASAHEPGYFEEFKCIGAACEDTCCHGMAVPIDQATFAKYQDCLDDELKPRLQHFVSIQPSPTPRHFARIELQNAQCPFLIEKLCGIQQKLGAEYLSNVCNTYPRIVHRSKAGVERSLDVSCPEAARLVLNQVKAIEFGSGDGTEPENWPLRKAIISILQNRRYSVSQRLLLVGHVCAKTGELMAAGSAGELPKMVEGFELAIGGGFFDAHVNSHRANASVQLAVALELIVGRIQLDYASPRFLALYERFTKGLGLTTDSTLDQLAANYLKSYQAHFLPFLEDHEHILENYLVAYAYKNQFPLLTGSVEEQYMLMATYFSMARTMLIGAAGEGETRLDANDAISMLQVFTRTMEHCTTLPALVLRTLAEKGISNIAGMAILSQSLITPKRKAARH